MLLDDMYRYPFPIVANAPRRDRQTRSELNDIYDGFSQFIRRRSPLFFKWASKLYREGVLTVDEEENAYLGEQILPFTLRVNPRYYNEGPFTPMQSDPSPRFSVTKIMTLLRYLEHSELLDESAQLLIETSREVDMEFEDIRSQLMHFASWLNAVGGDGTSFMQRSQAMIQLAQREEQLQLEEELREEQELPEREQREIDLKQTETERMTNVRRLYQEKNPGLIFTQWYNLLLQSGTHYNIMRDAEDNGLELVFEKTDYRRPFVASDPVSQSDLKLMMYALAYPHVDLQIKSIAADKLAYAVALMGDDYDVVFEYLRIIGEPQAEEKARRYAPRN